MIGRILGVVLAMGVKLKGMLSICENEVAVVVMEVEEVEVEAMAEVEVEVMEEVEVVIEVAEI